MPDDLGFPNPQVSKTIPVLTLALGAISGWRSDYSVDGEKGSQWSSARRVLRLRRWKKNEGGR